MYRSSYEHKSSVLWDKCSGVPMLGCRVVACLVFEETVTLFVSEWRYYFTFPPAMHKLPTFSEFLPTFGFVTIFYFSHSDSYVLLSYYDLNGG